MRTHVEHQPAERFEWKVLCQTIRAMFILMKKRAGYVPILDFLNRRG